MWSVPNIWQGERCWIIGGGPSVATQFNIPPGLVHAVREGKTGISAYSPYMAALHGEHVIGVNGAYKLGSWLDVCFFGDKDWYFANNKELEEWPGLVVGCAEFLALPGFEYLPVKHLLKEPRKYYGISAHPQRVCWNHNSGAAAISLAHHMGCKQIILLGFDMCLNNEGAGHWHNMYANKTDMPFHRHLVGFARIAKDAKELGIELLNASPNSAIKELKKVCVNELL